MKSSTVATISVAAVLVFSSVAFAQNRPAAPAKPFDPKDISGKWFRTTPIQTFSAVPGAPGGNFAEAPFTAAGKTQFDKNHPGYGPRAVPALRNDPMGTCDPLGVPRIVNAEVGSSHSWWEIVATQGRVFQFFEWHHDYRVIYTDGRKLPAWMKPIQSGTATRSAAGREIRSSWIRSVSMIEPGWTSSAIRTATR